MIYLIECQNYYKIGFTSDLASRLKSYDTTNPEYTVLLTEKGTKKDESELHKLCAEYHHKLEWFHKTPEILVIWKTYFALKDKYNKLEELYNQVKEDRNELNLFIDNLQESHYRDRSFIQNIKNMNDQHLSVDAYVSEYFNNPCPNDADILTNHEKRLLKNERELELLKEKIESLRKEIELIKQELFKNKEPNNELIL